MQIFFLSLVFAAIILLLALRRPLWQALLGSLIRRTLAPALCFCALMTAYYHLLGALL